MCDMIDELISKMTLTQKIGQLNQVMYNGTNFSEVAELIKEQKVGSIILANSSQAGNDKQENLDTQKTDKLQELAIKNGGIPILFGRDVIHGHKVVYPVPLAMAASFNPDLVEKCYGEIAEEAINDGVHWSFAPMADISRDSRWGRCIEGSGEDSYLGSKMAKAVINGFQNKNVAACIKHFIGYGASEGGRDYNSTEIGEVTLRNFYLRAFKEAVGADVSTVMSSFNSVSGIPVSANRYLLNDVLKNEFGFEGLVVSDWGSVSMLMDFGTAKDRKQSAQIAFNAGIDMEMVSGCYVEFMEQLVSEGKISVGAVDDALRKILKIKQKYGLFERPYAKKQNIDYKKHIESAVELAEQSIVLLKNKNNILPLEKNDKLSAIGPMLNNKRDLLGSWTLDFNIDYVKSFKDVLENEYSDVDVIFAENELQDSMIMTPKKREKAIVFLGEAAEVTGEARSVSNIEVPCYQVDLVKNLYHNGVKVIAVMCFGRPVALEEIEPYCDAILYSWHSGTGTAKAVIKTLFADNIPSGALPMTLPRRTGQIPIYYNQLRDGKNIDAYAYTSQSFKIYTDIEKGPMYPFGYGLSYTSFEYSNLKIDKAVSYDEFLNGEDLIVGIDVKNSGSYDAYETVQCYIRDWVSDIVRPLRELKGFNKIFLKKGEIKRVTFKLGKEELGYYNAQNKFVVDDGAYTIYAGKSAYAENAIDYELI